MLTCLDGGTDVVKLLMIHNAVVNVKTKVRHVTECM